MHLKYWIRDEWTREMFQLEHSAILGSLQIPLEGSLDAKTVPVKHQISPNVGILMATEGLDLVLYNIGNEEVRVDTQFAIKRVLPGQGTILMRDYVTYLGQSLKTAPSFRVEDISFGNYALLIGDDMGNNDHYFLECVRNDLNWLDAHLSSRGFSVTQLVNGSATIDNILRAIERVKPFLTASSRFLVNFNGHGVPEGCLIKSPYGAFKETTLHPHLLYSRLSDACPTAFIADVCHGKDIMKEETPPNINLLVAEGQRDLAFGMVSETNRQRGALSWYMQQFLESNPGEVDLANFLTYIKGNYPNGLPVQTSEGIEYQRPQMVGASGFTLPPIIPEL